MLAASAGALIVLVGPPGSGKTTWARLRGQGMVHVSQDALIAAITPHGFDHTWRPVYHAAEDAVARAALAAGHTVLIDRTNRTREHRARWLRIAREAGRPAIAIVMSTPFDLCRERNARRDAAARLTDERMERMLAAFEPVTEDEGFAAIEVQCGEVQCGKAQCGDSHRAVDFSESERRAVYRAIFERRDVRSQFLPTPIPEGVLTRILDAAHHAPSVGFMQPWDFVVIRDPGIRGEIHRNFEAAREAAAEVYVGERRARYDRLRLAGILDAPVNLCVTCDRARIKGGGLGRQTDPAVDLYSTVCAVQNLWLAARAESIGVGWVSILDFDGLKNTLAIPPGVTVVAYLCLGYVSEFRPQPDLEEKGWETRSPLGRLVHFDRWGEHAGE